MLMAASCVPYHDHRMGYSPHSFLRVHRLWFSCQPFTKAKIRYFVHTDDAGMRKWLAEA